MIRFLKTVTRHPSRVTSHSSRITRHARKSLLPALVLLFAASAPGTAYALASNNVPLDSPVYDYVEKLSGFGLLDTDIRGLRPYSRAEVARLLAEAQANEARLSPGEVPLAEEVMGRLKELVPREAELREKPGSAPFVDFNPLSYARLRYVHLDGQPRSYNRDIFVPGDQSVFGFIGGNLRPGTAGIGHESGTEGTPLLENNEGVIYRAGENGELRFAAEGYLLDKASLLVEPYFLATPESNALKLGKGYLKIGGGGSNWKRGGTPTGSAPAGAAPWPSRTTPGTSTSSSSPAPNRWTWGG